MKKTFRFTFMSIALIGAYLLSACGGTLPRSAPSEAAQKVQAEEIVFTGIVEQINGSQWVVSGQAFTVDQAAEMDSGIVVGDIVKVEGAVSADGNIVALKIEASAASDENTNDGNSNDDDNGNEDNDNGNNDNNDNDVNDNDGADENEVFGEVEAVTADSITVGGVIYMLAEFTEFKDAIAVGDQVKIHVIVNADGTFTIREIEKTDDLGDDDNSNSGNENDGNGNDDNSNDDNGNDDNSNDNSDDDNGNGDNSGQGGGDDDNSNDD